MYWRGSSIRYYTVVEYTCSLKSIPYRAVTSISAYPTFTGELELQSISDTRIDVQEEKSIQTIQAVEQACGDSR